MRNRIDTARFDALREKYAWYDSGPAYRTGYFKYFALDKYLQKNHQRARALKLEESSGKRILDLGSGCGYFLLVCECLGHEAVGVDFHDVCDDASGAYNEVCELFGVKRSVERIERCTPLSHPDVEGPFDLITAFQVCFDHFNDPDRWHIPEWRFFLRDLRGRLTDSGEVFLHLNRPDDVQADYPGELCNYFSSLGATCIGRDIHFRERKMLPR
jgi:cyclopropane fatty-acyl-phospholipid synthase-like methyltransferase